MNSNNMENDRVAVSREECALSTANSGWHAVLIAVAAVLLLLCGQAASAQTFRGTILGTVTDSSGAAVSGATVTVKNLETGLVRTATTADDGSYAVPELPIGNYSVTVENSGFKIAVVSGIHVEVSSQRRADVTLQPGEVTQKIEVSGEALPLVETTSNVMGGAFEARQVEDLPVNGRDFQKLLINVPGAAGEPNGAGDSPGSFGYVAVNGNRGRSDNFMLDGTDMNDGYRNDPAINQGGVFGTPGTVLPLDAVAEVRVMSNFLPEFGRNAGGVVNIVTKSGTNAFHGSAYEYFRNDHLNARNFFNTEATKDAFRNNQFGATLGGAIVKDKTFYFVAYEGQREGGAITSLNVVPSVADFQNAINTIQAAHPLLPASTPCTTTIIACITSQPAGYIDPVILNFFNFCQTKGQCSGGKDIWPGVNIANAAAGAANSVDAVRFSNNVSSMIAKIDHVININNQLTGRYFFGDSRQSFPLGLAGGNNLPGTNTVSPIRTQLVSVSLVSTVSTNVVNEARFGWNRYRNGFYPEDAKVFGNPNDSLGLNTGVTNPRDFGLPTMRFGTLSFLGSSPFSNPRDRVDTNWQAIEGLSWKLGRHDIKFGGEWRLTTVRSFNNFSSRGVLVFNALSDFLSGSPVSTVLFASRIIQGTTDRYAKQTNEALFVQDSFRWTRNFTLNMGMRWDYFGVIHEDQGRFSVYDPAVGLVHRDPLYDKDFRNIRPRVSVAWDVNGKQKTIVRAGIGVFFDDFSQDAFTGQIYENSFNAGVAYNAIAPDPVFLNKTFAANAIPFKPGVQIFTSTSANGPAPVQTTDASTVDKNLRTPYVYNFNLNVQQELFRNTVLQVGYVGSSGHKLLRLRDINQPTHAEITACDLAQPGSGCTCPQPGPLTCIQDGTVPRNFTTVLSAIAQNPPFIINQLEGSAVSYYHSLQTSLTQQNFHGWTNQITYTWSHSIDTASDSQDYVPNAAESQDGTNTKAEKGPSNFDLRNRFVWSSSYSLPKWESWGRMGEGWMVSGVVTVASGHPFSMNYNTTDDYSGSGSFVDRPDVVGPLQYNRSDPTQYLNLNSFAIPCTANGTGTGFAGDTCVPGTRHFGNLGRNGLIGPNYRNFDLAISKETSITERLKLVFRADAYNLLNHPNFASPLAVAFFADAAPNRSGASPSGVAPNGRNIGNLAITATSDVGVGNPVLGGGGTRSLQLAVRLKF